MLSAWTRPAQLAMAFLLGLATALVAANWYASAPWASRPSELQRGPGGAYRVDLNRAGHAELLQLPGVGEGLAQRIEDYRRAHGPFRSVNDLRNVRNVGAAALRRLLPWVCVQSDDSGEVAQPVLFRGSSRTDGAATPAAVPENPSARKPGKKAAGITRPIDLNRASATELQRLPGIGPVIAARIVEERRKAPFQSVDDLKGRVPGIGPKKLEMLRPYATVTGDGERVATAGQDENNKAR
jgi:competence protein ComEA